MKAGPSVVVTPGVLCRVWAAALAAALLGVQPGAQAADTAPATSPGAIVAKTRTQIAFRLALSAPGGSCAIAEVRREGKPTATPPNMKLDAKAGEFSWLPTESQAGDHEVTFAVRTAGGEESRVTRRIAVQPGPIVPPNDNSEVAKLLRAWYQEGTAAGNTGDFYDNRDGGHSMLHTARFPQLDKVVYTDEQKNRRLHWALQLRMLFDHVTFGNSSTASGDVNWGSNSRHCMLSGGAMQVLYRQYVSSHLYIYPEHRDHDPGHNGRGGGHGDLYPANTPYLITSQGSSGSDRPFMEAVGCTLAAFRPDTKRRLIETHLLMPTVQMIFRSSNRNVAGPNDYLTGAAHPSVFEGKNVDVAKMVRTAHAIQPGEIPPMIQLAVVDEDRAVPGRDYFDAGERERLFDTPAAIARIVRSTRQVRRMVVSAKASFDVNNRPLKFDWVVLRGDGARIKIRPLNDQATEAELLVPFHARRPIAPGSKMASNRVDIGVFAHNGVHYSAPGVVSLYSMDDEARTYDAHGRVVDVGYDYGDSTIGFDADLPLARDKGYDITDWPAMLALLGGDGKSLPSALLRERFNAQELADLQQAAKEVDAAVATEAQPQKDYDAADAALKAARDAVNQARKKLDEAKAGKARTTQPTQPALGQAEAVLKQVQDAQKASEQRQRDARRKLDEARRAAHRVLTAERKAIGGSVKARIEKALNDIKDDAGLYVRHAAAIEDLCKAPADAARHRALLAARDRLVKQGILKADGQGKLGLSPVVPGPEPREQRLTACERNRLEWFQVAVLREALYPGLLNRTYRRNWVSPFMATPKSWRDVYHYAPSGRLIGWTRYDDAGAAQDFTAEGAMIVKKDKLGRALEARPVRYTVEGGRGGPQALKQQLGDGTIRYEYASDEDLVGRVREAPATAP